MPTVKTLQPSLNPARGLSNWQQVVNHAGYAPSESDIRATGTYENIYVHTKSKSLLEATEARNVTLSGSSRQSRATEDSAHLAIRTRQDTQRQLCRDFLSHYGLELNRLAQEIPSRFWQPGGKTLDDFQRDARIQIDRIAQAHFPKGEAVPATDMRQRILQATIDAEKALLELRAQFSDDLNKAPQLFENKGKVTVIRPAPPLENLALRGGGTKGIGYIGQVRALEQQGVIRQLRHVAGTSAGALTASLIAGGLSAEKFAEVSRSRTPQQMFKGKDKGVEIKLKTGFYEASAIVSFIDSAIKESIQDFLNGDPPPDLTALPPADQQELRDLASAPPSKPVTFKHLDWLAGIKPDRFKNLTLAVFDATDKQTKHIGADNHPDWSIGQTARMSMAIPIVFKAVQGPDGHTYQDGGVGSNLPAEVFVKPDATTVPSVLRETQARGSKWTPAMQAHVNRLIDSAGAGRRLAENQEGDTAAKTLVIAFDEWGKFHQVASEGQLFSKPTALRALFGATAEATAADRLKIYSAGPNALAAFHGTLDTTTRNVSESTLDLVELFSEAKALEQVRQQLPMDRATYEVQDNLNAALQTLTTDELNLLQDACASRLAGGREIEKSNGTFGEVPDIQLLNAIGAELALRSPDAQPSVQQVLIPSEAPVQVEPGMEGLDQQKPVGTILVAAPSRTMPRRISNTEPPALDQNRATVVAREGIEGAERVGVNRSRGWFARIAMVTAGVLGMAGAAALGVLFPPAAPLIFVGALAATAGISRALEGGPANRRQQRDLSGVVDQRREAVRLHDRA